MFLRTVAASLLLATSVSARIGFFSRRSNTRTLEITVKNLAYSQPMSPFFVMVHDDTVDPVFAVNEPPSGALATLAELGNPADLVSLYDGTDGVSTAMTAGGAPPMGESTFTVEVDRETPYVSLVSMAVNTNDCFVGISGAMLSDGMILFTPGYDAGSEENDEECGNVPGPACAGFEGTAPALGEPEGFVHVHRGVHGVGSLTESVYDWRNPMLQIVVKEL